MSQLVASCDIVRQIVKACDTLWQYVTVYDSFWHLVTSCDDPLIVTLCNAESVTLQELVTGVGKCFPSSAFHDSADTCNAAEFSPVHAVDHVPVIVMAEVLRIPQNFRLHNWLEMPHNLSSLVIISYSLIIISFLHPFLNKAAPHRCFFRKNANPHISYYKSRDTDCIN